jgi:hypothetical protein
MEGTMATLKIFAWNMQRGECIAQGSTPQNEFTQRKAGLTWLCQNYDLGFITEPCKSFRGAIKASIMSGTYPAGQWIMCGKEDNQSESHACRPMLYLKTGLPNAKECSLNTKSGADEAHRYPAAAIVEYDAKILIVSLHATSGGAGANNLQDVLSEIEDKDKPAWHGWIIGGDFNAGDARYGGVSQTMATSATQKKGNILDGFTVGQNDDAPYEIAIGPVAPPSAFVLVPGTGCLYNGVRVYDHAPVAATVTISKREMDF